MSRLTLGCALLVATLATAQVPLGRGAGGLGGLAPAPGSAAARLFVGGAEVAVTPDTAATVTVRFDKPDPARRLIALHGRPADAAGCQSLVVRGRLELPAGTIARLAVLVVERGGEVWGRVAATPLAVPEARLSLTGLRQAAFSTPVNGRLDWDAVEDVWVGIAVDGAGPGAWTVESVTLTPEAYRPTEPLPVVGTWGVSQDPKVSSTLTTPAIDGRPSLRYEFNLPGGAHMYAIPACPITGGELDGYTHLRLTYRASLPAGLGGLLVMLSEGEGSQWYADPSPSASAEWTTVDLPITAFKLGAWTKDATGRLELGAVRNVHVGCHGVPAGAGGAGLIEARDIQFIVR